MAQSNSEADKMLDVYIYDYLVKKKLYNTADSFMTEANVSLDPAAIDTPGGFLFERWSMFWDICYAKTKEKHSESAVEYGLNVYIYDYLVKNHLYYTAKSFMTEVNVSPSHAEINTPGGFLSKWWYVFWAFFIARMNEKPSESAAQENNSEVNLGASPRQLPVNPSTVYGQGILPRMGSAGSNPGVGALPLKGWPLTGLDNMRQDLGPQGQRAFLQNQGQFQLPPQQQQQQQIMARDQGQGNMTNSSMYGQQNANDGSIGYPVPLNSSKPINMPPVQQYSSQQQDPLLSQQNNCKRTRTGNTVGPFNSQPSTPLTHTPIEGVAITGNMPKGPVMYVSDAIGDLASSANQLLWEVWDDMEAFEDVGALEDTPFVNLVLRGGLPTSANQLDDMEAFKDVDVESLYEFINWNPSESIEAQQDKVKEHQIQMKQPNPMNTGQLVQGSPQGGVSTSLQQLQSQTQKTPVRAGDGDSLKRICKCKKSKCLQLYCDCFAAGVFCTKPQCSCINCHNIPIHNNVILASRKKIESRNPHAFAPRIISRSSDSAQQTREDDASKTPASGRHIRGCNCKKSKCSNKYCECFQGGVGCTVNCKCEGCENTLGAIVSFSFETNKER